MDERHLQDHKNKSNCSHLACSTSVGEVTATNHLYICNTSAHRPCTANDIDNYLHTFWYCSPVNTFWHMVCHDILAEIGNTITVTPFFCLEVDLSNFSSNRAQTLWKKSKWLGTIYSLSIRCPMTPCCLAQFVLNRQIICTPQMCFVSNVLLYQKSNQSCSRNLLQLLPLVCNFKKGWRADFFFFWKTEA